MPCEERYIVKQSVSPEIFVAPLLPSSSPSELSISSNSDTESNNELNPNPVYEWIEIPVEPTLRDILKKAAGDNNLASLSKIKIQVITIDVSLQHISVHMPSLTELILDGSIMSSLRDLGCGLINLKILKVARCTLTSLDGLFGTENLEELHAQNNSIEDLSPCTYLPFIRLIDLRKNLIKNIDTVSFLSICEQLEHLTLEKNPDLDEIPQYRQVIKKFLPNLKTLDEADLINDPLEVEEAQNILNASSTTSTEEEKVCSELKDNIQKCKTLTKKVNLIEGTFTISFPPKVLSQRPTSGNPNETDIISACSSTSTKQNKF